MLPSSRSLSLPSWTAPYLAADRRYPDPAAQMALAIELSARNVAEGTGGPFGAAVFDASSGALLGLGVNVVLHQRTSLGHAEMMALLLAQAHLGQPRLDSLPAVLATSAQPCCMCFGALPWAGLSSLLVGALRDDVESLAGFDEGPVPPDWADLLRARGLAVTTGLLRAEAAAVLAAYRHSGGPLY